MKPLKIAVFPLVFVMFGAAMMAAGPAPKANTLPETDGAVRMVVTANVDDGKRVPEIAKEDIFVKNGKERLHVLDWAPAQGERAGLELFFLIDDSATPGLGVHLDDLRAFIKSQPGTTAVGVGYARNGTVEIRQNLTEHRE